MRVAAAPRRRLVVEPRARSSPATAVLVPLASLAGAAVVGILFLLATGHGPFAVYATMAESSFGSWRHITDTLVSATPLILTGSAAALAFKLLVWNIGAEGQLYAGAILTAGVALALGDGAPAAVAVPLAVVAGAVGGAVWAGLAAVPRALLGTNEIITTLMLNYVALRLMDYLIFGSASAWRDPAVTNFPQGRPIPDAAQLPLLSPPNRLHAGIFVAVGAAALLWWALRWTRWGFEVRVVGDSPTAARYAGINLRRKIIAVFCLSGALAGLAGAVEVGGIVHSLEPRALQTGLGYTGIIVAALARLNPLAVIPVAVLIGALDNAGSALQITSVPYSIVLMLQGAILFFAVAGEFLSRNRVRWAARTSVEVHHAEPGTAGGGS